MKITLDFDQKVITIEDKISFEQLNTIIHTLDIVGWSVACNTQVIFGEKTFLPSNPIMR